ncbi:MAG: PilZ domain-containing protein [Smithella sp.]
MKDKRKAQRLKEFNEITIAVISGDKHIAKDKMAYNYSEDISATGAKIRGNILLPVDTLLKIDFTLKALKKQITAVGKVKWIKIIIEDKFYEAGVEFVDTAGEAIKKIEDYIAWKRKNASLQPFGIIAKFNEPESK